MRYTKTILIAGIIGALFTAFAGVSPAQEDSGQEEPWVYWGEAPRLIAQMSIDYSDWTDYSHPGWEDHSNGSASETFWIELVREVPEGYAGSTTWNAVKMRAEGFFNNSKISKSINNDLQSYKEHGSFSQTIEAGMEGADLLENINLTLNHETGEWQLVSPGDIKPYHVQYHSEYRQSSSDHTDVTNEIHTETSAHGTVFNGQIVAGAGMLQAVENQTFKDDDGTNGWTKTGHITVLPEWADVKLVVTLEAYDSEPPQGAGAKSGGPGGETIPYEKWRPRASMEHPGMAGNYLNVTAELRPSDIKKNDPLPEVRKITFELLDTSREPGVMMNWPRGAMSRDSDKKPDMRLFIDPFSPGELGEEAQTLEVANPKKSAESRPTAQARIDSYDFGGRTELRVTAELKSGRKILGALEAAGYTYTEIRLPKRIFNDWIADAWLQEKEVTQLADDDDSEDNPEGDGDKGDGFSLYEEYRGFAAKRMKDGRVEGDPKRKDLFVLNLIGADAVQGIKWFERESGLRTIYQLVEPEILENDRVVNFNYDKAPYRLDDKGKHNNQHAIVLKTLTPQQMGGHGAKTTAITPAGKAFRPKTVQLVALPSRSDPEADTNKPHNLSPADVAIGYPRTIVHEMLHAVGVSHHGEGDTWGEFFYVPETYKNNPSGEQLFWMEEYKRDKNGNTVHLRSLYVKVLEEKSGESYAKKISPEYNDWLEEMTRQKAEDEELPEGTTFKDLDAATQSGLIHKLIPDVWAIGKNHGQHSGDEQCPLRYKFAEVYKSKVSVGHETYYLVPKGSEDVGVTICKSDKGTNVNSKTHKPQSRYGNAADHRGKCEKQINVNDAMPLHPEGWR